MLNRSRALLIAAIMMTLLCHHVDFACGSATTASRKLLQRYVYRNTNLAANTVRSQAATSQAIQEAVDNGGGYGYTRHAGRVGSTLAWAAGQDDQVFNAAERWVGK